MTLDNSSKRAELEERFVAVLLDIWEGEGGRPATQQEIEQAATVAKQLTDAALEDL